MPTNVILSQVPTIEKVQQAEQQKSDQMQADSALREGEESRRRTETVRNAPESERAKSLENEREEKRKTVKKRKNPTNGEQGEDQEQDGRVEAEPENHIVDIII